MNLKVPSITAFGSQMNSARIRLHAEGFKPNKRHDTGLATSGRASGLVEFFKI